MGALDGQALDPPGENYGERVHVSLKPPGGHGRLLMNMGLGSERTICRDEAEHHFLIVKLVAWSEPFDFYHGIKRFRCRRVDLEVREHPECPGCSSMVRGSLQYAAALSRFWANRVTRQEGT